MFGLVTIFWVDFLQAALKKFSFSDTLNWKASIKKKHEKANESLLSTYAIHVVRLKTAFPIKIVVIIHSNGPWLQFYITS